MTIEIGFLIAVLGCFIGVAGWFRGRDTKIAQDAEWKGKVDAKLDIIVGVKKDVNELQVIVSQHGERLTAVESSSKQAHHRIDELVEGGKV